MNNTRPSDILGIHLQRSIEQIELQQRLDRLLSHPGLDVRDHPENIGKLSWRNCAWIRSEGAESLAMASYVNGEWPEFIKWSLRTGETLRYYLLGEWMEKEPHDDGEIKPNRYFREEPETWCLVMDFNLPWVAVGCHWNLVDEIMKFPASDIAADGSGQVAKAYYLGLADWWRNRENTAGLQAARETRGRKSRLYHELCNSAVAISEKDTATLGKRLTKYVELYLKQRDHDQQMPMPATFLWNVAKKDGLEVGVDPEIGKYLFEIPDSYWQQEQA